MGALKALTEHYRKNNRSAGLKKSVEQREAMLNNAVVKNIVVKNMLSGANQRATGKETTNDPSRRPSPILSRAGPPLTRWWRLKQRNADEGLADTRAAVLARGSPESSEVMSSSQRRRSQWGIGDSAYQPGGSESLETHKARSGGSECACVTPSLTAAVIGRR